MKVNWSIQAVRDAEEAWLYIAAGNPDAADRVIARIHAALELLSENPKMGRQGAAGKTREFVVSGTPYILVYEVVAGTIEVRRVIHGARQMPPGR